MLRPDTRNRFMQIFCWWGYRPMGQLLQKNVGIAIAAVLRALPVSTEKVVC
jgi:hypothetical protein